MYGLIDNRIDIEQSDAWIVFISDAPKTFLVQFLEELDAGQGGTYDLPALFDESNTESIFGMLDPTTTGVITLVQYKEGMSCTTK